MTVRSALVRCLASPANGFGSETQRFGKSIYSQLARVSRDLRAVSGTPNLDMPVHSERMFPRYRWAEFLCGGCGGILFFIFLSPLYLAGVLMVYLSLVVFVMVATRNRNLHTS